jgi:hypothetical protein
MAIDMLQTTDVQMCLSMIVSWLATHTDFMSPYPRGRKRSY